MDAHVPDRAEKLFSDLWGRDHQLDTEQQASTLGTLEAHLAAAERGGAGAASNVASRKVGVAMLIALLAVVVAAFAGVSLYLSRAPLVVHAPAVHAPGADLQREYYRGAYDFCTYVVSAQPTPEPGVIQKAPMDPVRTCNQIVAEARKGDFYAQTSSGYVEAAP